MSWPWPSARRPGCPSAWAQAAASSTIHGAATDETGATMPGVTVTLSSPQLQAQKRGDRYSGRWHLPVHRAARRHLSARRSSSPGSARSSASELRITIGFTARVDAKMAIGGLEESVTVSGPEPGGRFVVDEHERDVHHRGARGGAARPRLPVGRRDGAGRHPRGRARRRRQPDGAAARRCRPTASRPRRRFRSRASTSRPAPTRTRPCTSTTPAWKRSGP